MQINITYSGVLFFIKVLHIFCNKFLFLISLTKGNSIMKKPNVLFVILMSIIFVVQSHCQEYPKVQLETTIIREIQSEFVEGMTYELYIDLPPSYSDSSKTFPVVYLLDAYEIFGLQNQTYQQLIFLEEKEIPELILVGISYPNLGDFYTDGLREYMDIRARDFLPTYLSHDEIVQKHGKELARWARESGGGQDFLNFIEKELIPFIETEYRTDTSKRGLFGFSFGGTFVTYAMFSKPGLFKNYFIGSPMLNWDDKVVYKFDSTDELIGTANSVNVYISFGELESKEGTHHPLNDYLIEKKNPNINFISEVLEGETHLSGYGLAYSRAFRRLYELK